MRRLSRRVRRAMLTAVLAAPLLGGRPARAAEPSAPSASDKDTARTLMVRGLDQRKSGALDDALQSFRAADAIMHVPTTALEVARTEQALGHWVDARETAVAALRVPAKASEPAPFKDARALMQALVDDLGTRIPSVVIHVTGAPAGVAVVVSLDGHEVPAVTLGMPRKVDPGHHVLEGTLGRGAIHEDGVGDITGHLELDVAERETKEAQLVLAPRAAPRAARGEAAATAHKTDGLKITELTAFGVGGAALVTGIVTGIVSLSKTSTVRSRCGGDDCPADVYYSGTVAGDRSTAHTLATVSTVGFVVAGAGAALGVTCLVLRSRRAKDEPPGTQAGWTLAPGIFAGSF